MAARSLPTLLILLLVSLEGARAARVLDHLGLDQLCATATLIVKGEVGDAQNVSTRDGDCAVWNVKVLAVWKGTSHPDETIKVAGIEEYHKGPGLAGLGHDFPQLAKGEIIYLFLAPQDAPIGYAKYHLTDANWQVIESGLRLVEDGKVYDFAQYDDQQSPTIAGPAPGFVTMTEKTFPGTPIPSVQTFEKQLQKTLHLGISTK